MAALSILFGGLSALGADRVEGLLAYSSIGQVGFIVLPLSVAAFAPADATAVRRLGIVAALVYALNHTLSGLLFLVGGPSGTPSERRGSTTWTASRATSRSSRARS